MKAIVSEHRGRLHLSATLNLAMSNEELAAVACRLRRHRYPLRNETRYDIITVTLDVNGDTRRPHVRPVVRAFATRAIACGLPAAIELSTTLDQIPYGWGAAELLAISKGQHLESIRLDRETLVDLLLLDHDAEQFLNANCGMDEVPF